MTNPEAHPVPLLCEDTESTGIEIIDPRDVPLGGPRAMTVRRTLPSRQRSLIGAWCFLDHYGPDDVSLTGGMKVAPHPHTGLQTVSWLFSGEIEHRDSAGHHATVRPGELNLMTGGRGISHSEISRDASDRLHGAQLWVALPDAARNTMPGFAHHVPQPVAGPGWEARVFLGSLLGDTSPVATFTPLVGAEIVLDEGAILEIPIDPAFEHGVLVDGGSLALVAEARTPEQRGATEVVEVVQHQLAFVPRGSTTLTVEAGEAARILVLGGAPFGEAIVMWWNFVGRTHEEVVGYREEWQAQITGADGAVVSDSELVAAGRFGVVAGDHLPPIPAPPMPQGVRLRERR